MDAMILAAGEGTRLRPISYLRPKPLLPVLNEALLQWTLRYLNRFSIDRVILNTHHLATHFETGLLSLDKGKIKKVETRYEPQILNTGGGLVNARDFFQTDPFLVISGDILTDIDIAKAVEFHQSHPDPVTLILHDYPEFNQILVDSRTHIQKFREGYGRGLDFANIHILDRAVFDFLPAPGNFDITTAYQEIIDRGIPIHGYVSRGHYWRNIGTPETYLKVHEELLTTPSSTLSPTEGRAVVGGLSKGILIHPQAFVEKNVEFSGWACIGKGCRLKSGCRIENSILWEDIVVESGISISGSIISRAVRIEKDLSGEIIA
ncbi:MAG: NDP-sugar synthase [Thermodesulfobacteriota bacterium]